MAYKITKNLSHNRWLIYSSIDPIAIISTATEAEAKIWITEAAELEKFLANDPLRIQERANREI